MSLTKVPGPMIGADLADLSGDLPASRITGKKVWWIATSTDYDLPYSAGEISLFRKVAYFPEDGLVFLTWQVDCRHRGINAGSPHGTAYPIGLGGYVVFRRAALEENLSGDFTAITTSVGAGQIRDLAHHYTTIGVARIPFAVDAGYFYEFSLAMTAHTDAGTMNGVDGSAEITPNGGENYLQIEFEPGVTLEI